MSSRRTCRAQGMSQLIQVGTLSGGGWGSLRAWRGTTEACVLFLGQWSVTGGAQDRSEPRNQAGPSFFKPSCHFPSSSFQLYFTQMSDHNRGERGPVCGPRWSVVQTQPGAGAQSLHCCPEEVPQASEDAGKQGGSWGSSPCRQGAREGAHRFPLLCHFLCNCVTLLSSLIET